MADFLTAVRYDLPIIVIVLNNSKLAFITMEQEVRGLPDYGTELTNPDFAAIADACGGLGLSVSDPDQIPEKLEEALASGQPAVLDVAVDPDELIMPPRIKLGEAARFGLAKLREVIA